MCEAGTDAALSLPVVQRWVCCALPVWLLCTDLRRWDHFRLQTVLPILLLRWILLPLRGVVEHSVTAAVFLAVSSVSEESIGVVSEVQGVYLVLSQSLLVEVWLCTCCQMIHCRCQKFGLALVVHFRRW
jgi:hypothetical protein